MLTNVKLCSINTRYFTYELNNGYDAKTTGNELTIRCFDREKHLIYGLVHEITEASIEILLKRLESIMDPQIGSVPFFGITISHMMAHYSLPAYGPQKRERELIEPYFKKHRQN